MMKFRIKPKIQEEEKRKSGKVVLKFQNYRFFDIFLVILHKINENFCQEHVKRGLLSL